MKTPLPLARAIARFALVALGALTFAACGDSPPVTPPPPVTETPDAGEQVTAAPTYHQDIAPILSKNCSSCHAEGGIGHLNLTTEEDVTSLAYTIANVVTTYQMPPWPPKGESPKMLYERKLTEAEIATIVAWVNGGTPAGDRENPASLPQPEVIDIGVAEIQVDIGVDYEPDETLHDDYRCFAVDLNTDAARVATGYRVTPGAKESVHHVLVYLYDAAHQTALQELDAEDARPGWQCFSGPTPESSSAQSGNLLGGWVPGTSSVKFPAGVGMDIPAGSLAVVQVHYHVDASHPDVDRTQIDIALASAEDEAGLQRARTYPVAKTNLNIPADAPDHAEVLSRTVNQLFGGYFNAVYPDGDAHVVGVIGHMHLLGKSFSLSLTSPANERRTLLDIPDWDFNWQGTYLLAEETRFNAADTLRMECRFDNSPANRLANDFETPSGPVTWGEGTFDEMCLAYVVVTDDAPTP